LKLAQSSIRRRSCGTAIAAGRRAAVLRIINPKAPGGQVAR
jgi:hypothetical protein